MKNYVRVIALVLICALAIGVFVGCHDKKQEQRIIGKINGEVLSDGLFINTFANKIYQASSEKDPIADFNLKGIDLYNALIEAKKEGKSYYDIFIDESLEESRRFMIEYIKCSGAEKWPSESDIKEIRESSAKYIKQMFSYYGTSMGAANENEFVKVAYSMTYDDLMEYYILSSTLAKYKETLMNDISLTDDDIAAFYEANIEAYRTVQVRHSLILTENMDEDEKKDAYKDALKLVKKYEDGDMTFDEIVKKSDDKNTSTGQVNNDGYYTVYKGAGFVTAFEDWAVKQTETSDKLEIVETEYGYHIMMCTKVYDLTDKDVKERVATGYKTDKVNEKIENDVKPLLEDAEYDIKDLDRAYADKLAKRTFTGDFSESGDKNSSSDKTAAPTASPTSKPEYNDAAMNKQSIAKYKGQDVFKLYYIPFFSQAVNSIFADIDITEFGDTEKERFENLKKKMEEEYADGKTYMEYAKEEAFNLLIKFLATKDMAVANGKGLSDEKITKLLDEFDISLDQMMEYYGPQYKVSTRDELMMELMGMNVNDYKELYIAQTIVSDYSEDLIDDVEAKKEDLKKYYDEHADDYRIVTIRHISRKLLDSDDKLLSEDKQADVLKLIEAIKVKYENGDSAEALVEGYSQASDVSRTAGLIDLTSKSTAIAKDVVEWAYKQTELGAAAIIKTDSSYELVIIEGIITFDEAKGVAASTTTTVSLVKDTVETAYKSEVFDSSISKYISDNKLEFTDVNNDLVDEIVEAYFTYKSDSDDESSSSPTPAESTAK